MTEVPKRLAVDGARTRRKPARLEPTEDGTGTVAVEGALVTEAAAAAGGNSLSSLEPVKKQLNGIKGDDPLLRCIHRICYGTAGQKAILKRRVNKWAGLAGLDEATRAARVAKMQAAAGRMQAGELRGIAKVCCMRSTGTKAELVTRVCDFLVTPNIEAMKPSLVKAKGKATKAKKTKKKKSTATKTKKEKKKPAASGEATTTSTKKTKAPKASTAAATTKKKQKKDVAAKAVPKRSRANSGDSDSDAATGSEASSGPRTTKAAKKSANSDVTTVTAVSTQRLRIAIKQITKGPGGELLTLGGLRKELEQRFGQDLAARKREIRNLVKEVI